MEGRYLYGSGSFSKIILEKIKSEKQKIKICSLSKDPNNYLMWSHYCDGHTGLVFGVEINSFDEVRDINYDGLLNLTPNNYSDNSAIDILSQKHNVWNYEKEVRVFVRDKNYTDVEIKQIIIGSRMSTQDQSLFKKLVESINPDIKILKSDIDYV